MVCIVRCARVLRPPTTPVPHPRCAPGIINLDVTHACRMCYCVTRVVRLVTRLLQFTYAATVALRCSGSHYCVLRLYPAFYPTSLTYGYGRLTVWTLLPPALFMTVRFVLYLQRYRCSAFDPVLLHYLYVVRIAHIWLHVDHGLPDLDIYGYTPVLPLYTFGFFIADGLPPYPGLRLRLTPPRCRFAFYGCCPFTRYLYGRSPPTVILPHG